MSTQLSNSLIFFATLLVVLILLQERRNPGAALAWLFLVILLPFIGIPLYFVARIWGKNKVRQASVISTGAAEKRSGNQIDLISNGTDAFFRLLKMIEEATHTIHISTFILGRDRVAETIVKRLARKSKDGVKVRFLLDGVGALFTNTPCLSKIREAGGQAAFFMPLFRLPIRGYTNLRNHRKIVVVDGVQAMTGGMNLAREYMGPDVNVDRWNDLSIFLRGPAVGDLEKIFKSDWKFATGESIDSRKGAERQSPGQSIAQVVASGPDIDTDCLYDDMLAAIFTAKKRIWIATPYFILDQTLTRALEYACRRGVDVQILTPRHSNHALADLGRAGYLRHLQEKGANILLHPKMLHAKATIIDDSYAIVGSANMDMRSFFLSYEVSLFLHSKEDIDAVSQWYLSLAQESDKGYPNAVFLMRTMEGVSRILSPLL